jgi:hypothetical protein
MRRRRSVSGLLTGLALLHAWRAGTGKIPKTGTVLGMPYDWRRPTIARVKARLWNPDGAHLFVPRAFGIGWDINFARLIHRRSR